MAKRKSKQQHLVPTAKQAAKMVKAQGKPRKVSVKLGRLEASVEVEHKVEPVLKSKLDQELALAKTIEVDLRKHTKVDHPTLVTCRCADSNRSLDVAVVFIKAGGSTSDAVQVAADAGIDDAVEESTFELPDTFDADDYGLRWDAAYVG